MNRKLLSTAIALLMMLSCVTPVLAGTPVFTDVPADHKHKAAIEYCAQNEFIVGRGDGIFDPNGTITRVEFVTIWAKTFHARKHDFRDATKTQDYMDNAIVLMQGLGYVSGVHHNEFGRNSNITREEVAQIVFNTYLKGISSDEEHKNYTDYAQISGWAQHAVSVNYKKGVFDTVVEGASFKPKQHMTRAEVCAILMRLLKTEVSPHLYNITIADMEHGTVEADKDKAAQGETVTLTIKPEAGYKYVDGSLKYNGVPVTGNHFEMPADDVEITAEFEAEEPAEPGEPGEPEEPGEPGEPEEPGEGPGETPTEPEEPKEPGEPGEPKEPGEPGEPEA
jgi:hypothetical protein